MVTLRNRLFLAFFILVGLGFYALVDWTIEDLRPRYLQSMEESMVDTATLLSSIAAQSVIDGRMRLAPFANAFEDVERREFSATIYEIVKTSVNMRVYITDADGIVIFDSDGGRDEGEDYSFWNDVHRTLAGEYGARTTRSDPADLRSSVLYVASPIIRGGEILGVLSVSKPADSVTPFIQAGRRRVLIAAGLAAIAVIFLGMAVSAWVTRPLGRLTGYAHSIGKGARPPLPDLGRGEIATLGQAFEEMRDALEGKRYVENYVQALTHEMKSSLAAARGAAELLNEEMPATERKKFAANIVAETQRLQRLIDRLHDLSALESRKGLLHAKPIDLTLLIQQILDSIQPQRSKKKLEIRSNLPASAKIDGEEPFIVQALVNLIQNAVDFSNPGGTIEIEMKEAEKGWSIRIADDGAGIPEWAVAKVFDRFYSLQRPDTGRKSSGLGLTVAREAIRLHGGLISIANRPSGGAEVSIRLPKSQPASKA